MTGGTTHLDVLVRRYLSATGNRQNATFLCFSASVAQNADSYYATLDRCTARWNRFRSSPAFSRFVQSAHFLLTLVVVRAADNATGRCIHSCTAHHCAADIGKQDYQD